MTAADKLTLSRLVLTPIAIFLLFVPRIFGGAPWSLILLWIIAAYSEFSDFLDGYVARRSGKANDFGKVFDPFADVLMHMSYFIAFAVIGVLPLAFVLVILFREYSIMLLRTMTAKKGVLMGARPGGKLKTVSYVITGAAALFQISLRSLGIWSGFDPVLGWIILGLCCISAVLSVLSLIDYFIQYRKLSGPA